MKWHNHCASVIYSILIIYVSININYLDLHVFSGRKWTGVLFDLLDNTPTFHDWLQQRTHF